MVTSSPLSNVSRYMKAVYPLVSIDPYARTPEKTNLRSLSTAISVQPELESALMHSPT